jgi:MraZ protein
VFKGSYRYKIDAKGRLPLPPPFRKALAAQGSALVATRLDGCVALYSESEWQRLENQLRRLPAFAKQTKALTRHLASQAADCSIDSQGRVLIPPALRGLAGLKREAVVVGALDRIEVWAPDAWADFLRDSERLLEDVTLDVSWPLPERGKPTPSGPGSTAEP